MYTLYKKVKLFFYKDLNKIDFYFNFFIFLMDKIHRYFFLLLLLILIVGYVNYNNYLEIEKFSQNIKLNKKLVIITGSLTNLAKPNLLSSMLDFESKDSKLAGSNNGKYNAIAGIGIFFGINDHRNISKKIEGKQTNNAAELTAIIETYTIIEKDVVNGKKIAIVSDSEYAIKCVSSYGEKCDKKGWNVDIPNKELVQRAYELYNNNQNIQFIHIRAHTNNTDIHSIGNDNADKLANIAIGLDSCPYLV